MNHRIKKSMTALAVSIPIMASVSWGNINLTNVRSQIQTYIESLRITGGDYGLYKQYPNSSEPSLYGSTDAALARAIMGENLTSTVSNADRTEWANFINSFALPDGTYVHEPSEDKAHRWWHRNGEVIGALRVIGKKQKYPVFDLYSKYNTNSEAIDFLDNDIDWANIWGASHQIWGGMLMYSRSSAASSSWRNTVLNWLDDEVNTSTGWWRKGVAHSNSAQGVGGAAHIWPLYELNNRNHPTPEAIIDSILAAQKSNGAFYYNTISYVHLDALYGLRLMSDQVPNYRKSAINTAIDKFANYMHARLNSEGLSGDFNMHRVLAWAGCYGLLNQYNPNKYTDNRTWSDIFSDPRFSDTAAVETSSFSAPSQTDPGGAYATAMNNLNPTAFWRLGDQNKPFAVGSVSPQARSLAVLKRNPKDATAEGVMAGNLSIAGVRPSDTIGGQSATGFSSSNRAFDFNGSSEYLYLPDRGVFDPTTAFTIAAWIRPTSSNSNNGRGILEKYAGTGNQRAYSLLLKNGKLRLIVSKNGKFGGSDSAEVATGSNIPLNTWSHVVATFSANNYMRLYVNGVLTASKTSGVPNTVHNSSAPLRIGVHFNVADNSRFFGGRMDEIGFFKNTALSTSQIQTLYNAAFGGSGSSSSSSSSGSIPFGKTITFRSKNN